MTSLSPLFYLEVIARAGSIRKAAETLAITSTALNRRLLALEDELGTTLFERFPRGVRLSAAGELMIEHVRNQALDLERVKSQISELRGERRGHVSIACSQAFLPYFLPGQISIFRRSHPGVAFTVLRRDREAAEQSLLDRSADIALVVEPISLSVLHTVARVQQDIHAVMRTGHPLEAMEVVRLGDCLRFPVALPTTLHGVRQLLDLALGPHRRPPHVVVESDSFEFLRNCRPEEDVITFQIPVGLPGEADGQFIHRPVDERDIRPAELFLAHLRDRTLPAPAASFLAQINRTLGDIGAGRSERAAEMGAKRRPMAAGLVRTAATPAPAGTGCAGAKRRPMTEGMARRAATSAPGGSPCRTLQLASGGGAEPMSKPMTTSPATLSAAPFQDEVLSMLTLLQTAK